MVVAASTGVPLLASRPSKQDPLSPRPPCIFRSRLYPRRGGVESDAQVGVGGAVCLPLSPVRGGRFAWARICLAGVLLLACVMEFLRRPEPSAGLIGLAIGGVLWALRSVPVEERPED